MIEVIQPPPVTPGIEVVSYDLPSSLECARFPADLIRSVATSTDERRLLMQDAMILASALRYKAAYVVTMDKGLIKLAQAANMNARGPDEFLKRQRSMTFGD